MKKFIFTMIAVIMSAVISVNAQIYSNYDGETKFFDNWSIGLEGGVQTNLHDWNMPQGGVAGITLNKQFVPAFGMSIEGYAGFNNTGNWISTEYSHHVHNRLVADNVQVYLTGRWNLMNSFGGYTGKPRVFEIETNVGFGYGHFFYHKVNDPTVDVYYPTSENVMLGKAGLNFNFNLGKERAWTITLKPAVVWNFTDDGTRFQSEHAVFQATAGVTYHFGTSNGKHYIAGTPVPELTRTIGELNAEVNNLRALVAELEARPVQVETVVEKETVTETKLVQTTYVVTFAFNSYELTDAAEAVLNSVPEGTTVKVVAYASPEGSATYNEKLSDNRASAIAEYLTKRGVKVASVDGLGVDGNASNRIGIVTVTE